MMSLQELTSAGENEWLDRWVAGPTERELADLPSGSSAPDLDDKIFCVYMANDPEAIREHARLAGFPADAIHRVGTVIDPTTGEDTSRGWPARRSTLPRGSVGTTTIVVDSTDRSRRAGSSSR